MKRSEEYFLKYIKYDTQSSSKTETHPSTPGQLILGKVLEEDLNALGLYNVSLSEQGIVMAFLPASPGYEDAPVLGLIAHMDTSDAASGKDIKPSIVTYTGDPIPLGTGERVLDAKVFPALNKMVGHRLVVTDGTTLLGADDKAGIAAIMAVLEEINEKNIPHGRIAVAFTPDEEIGKGTDFFDVKAFGADFAYTVDGSDPCEVKSHTFNSAVADVTINGVLIHPGAAKGIMVNATKVAMEFDAFLPQDEIPAKTAGFEGYYHLRSLEGDVKSAKMKYSLCDHDKALFEAKKERLLSAAKALNYKYGADTVTVAIKNRGRNMNEVIKDHPELLRIAEDAIRSVGLEPTSPPVRGGTDGAYLSFKGLPCPNIGNGGRNFHGEYEYLSLDENAMVITIILHIIESFSKRNKDLSFRES